MMIPGVFSTSFDVGNSNFGTTSTIQARSGGRSGVGAAVAANKVRGVRAALCGDTYSGHQCREHDDCKVLCLGARVTGVELALEIVRAFIGASFTGEERHRRRLAKIAAMESEFNKE